MFLPELYIPPPSNNFLYLYVCVSAWLGILTPQQVPWIGLRPVSPAAHAAAHSRRLREREYLHSKNRVVLGMGKNGRSYRKGILFFCLQCSSGLKTDKTDISSSRSDGNDSRVNQCYLEKNKYARGIESVAHETETTIKTTINSMLSRRIIVTLLIVMGRITCQVVRSGFRFVWVIDLSAT